MFTIDSDLAFVCDMRNGLLIHYKCLIEESDYCVAPIIHSPVWRRGW